MAKCFKSLLAASLCCGGVLSLQAVDKSELNPVSDSYVLDKDTVLNTAKGDLQGLLANDNVPGGIAGIELMSIPQHGKLKLTSKKGDFIYVPEKGFVGTDGFDYALVGDNGIGTTASVELTVSEGGSDNELQSLPLGDNYVMDANSKLDTLADNSIKGILANDDLAADYVEIELMSMPVHGKFDIDVVTGEFVYTPEKDYVGTDGFDYALVGKDGIGETVSVVFTINEVGSDNELQSLPLGDNYVMDANSKLDSSADDSIKGILANDDLTADYVEIELMSMPVHGKLDIDVVTGEFVYTPEKDYVGTDGFDYALVGKDGIGETASVVFTINEVGSDNELQSLPLDDSYVMDANSKLDSSADDSIKGILANDDLTADYVEIELMSMPVHGKLDIDVVTGEFVYTPEKGYVGTDGFDYALVGKDGIGETASVVFTINEVGSDNELQSLPLGDKYVVDTNSKIDTLANDSIKGILANDDLAADYVEIELMSMPVHGKLDIDVVSGEFVYTPEEGYVGTDGFDYALVGENGIGETASVVFMVKGQGSGNGQKVTGGSKIKLEIKSGDVFKVYAKANGKKYKMRVKTCKDGANVDFSKKCFKHKVKVKSLLGNIKPGDSKNAEVVVVKNDGTKETMKVEVNCPKIAHAYVDAGFVVIDGMYFGAKPKVFLVNEEAKKIVKMKTIKRKLKYHNAKGKPVCMDEVSGASEVVLTPKKEMPAGTYKVIVINNIGIGSDIETKEIPELTVE